MSVWDRLKARISPPIWARITFLYGERRPSPEDYWSMLGDEKDLSSEWPFKEIAAWEGVTVHPVDEFTKSSVLLPDDEHWELYVSELGDDGEGPRVGALSAAQVGVCISFDKPGEVRTSKFSAANVGAFQRLARLLAPLHELFGAKVVAMGEEVDSVEAAIERVMREVAERLVDG